MTATIHQLAVPVPVLRASCTVCKAEASCECNAPYVPARDLAAEQIKLHPEKSNRMIAAETGASKDSVARIRAATGAREPVKRIGLDGKARSLPAPTIVTPTAAPPVMTEDEARKICTRSDWSKARLAARKRLEEIEYEKMWGRNAPRREADSSVHAHRDDRQNKRVRIRLDRLRRCGKARSRTDDGRAPAGYP